MQASTCRKFGWPFLAIIFMPLLTSCSIMVAGQKVVHVTDPTASAWLEFEGAKKPCVKPVKTFVENLGEGAPTSLWKERGIFYFHPSGDIDRVYYTYFPGGLQERQGHGRDMVGRLIYGPDYKIVINNAGSNTNVTLTITVYYRSLKDPRVYEYDIYNQNLREMCQGYNLRR